MTIFGLNQQQAEEQVLNATKDMMRTESNGSAGADIVNRTISKMVPSPSSNFMSSLRLAAGGAEGEAPKIKETSKAYIDASADRNHDLLIRGLSRAAQTSLIERLGSSISGAASAVGSVASLVGGALGSVVGTVFGRTPGRDMRTYISQN